MVCRKFILCQFLPLGSFVYMNLTNILSLWLTIARARYTYTAAIPEELSFNKLDILAIVRTQSDGWWEAEIVGEDRSKPGLVPSNYLMAIWFCLFPSGSYSFSFLFDEVWWCKDSFMPFVLSHFMFLEFVGLSGRMQIFCHICIHLYLFCIPNFSLCSILLVVLISLFFFFS